MLMLVSFPSFFSFFVSKEALLCAACVLMDERNESNEERRLLKPGLISLISCNSFFSLFLHIQEPAGSVVHNPAFGGQFWACFCLPSPGAISESQHTRCAHRALPGLVGGSAPSTPCKGKSHADRKP